MIEIEYRTETWCILWVDCLALYIYIYIYNNLWIHTYIHTYIQRHWKLHWNCLFDITNLVTKLQHWSVNRASIRIVNRTQWAVVALVTVWLNCKCELFTDSMILATSSTPVSRGGSQINLFSSHHSQSQLTEQYSRRHYTQ